MTVRELMAFLATVDPDLPVICDRYSDYVEQEMPQVIQAARVNGRWTTYYQNQWRVERDGEPDVRWVLHFEGN
jgi:hypothetical protein